MVVLNNSVNHSQRECVAIVVDSAAAAAAGCSALRRIGAVADSEVVCEQAIDDRIRDTDAAEPTTVRADVSVPRSATKRAVDTYTGRP